MDWVQTGDIQSQSGTLVVSTHTTGAMGRGGVALGGIDIFHVSSRTSTYSSQYIILVSTIFFG